MGEAPDLDTAKRFIKNVQCALNPATAAPMIASLIERVRQLEAAQQWEYGTRYDTGPVDAHDTEEDAHRQAVRWGEEVVRRRVGPWEPMPDTEEQP